ncbi:MAG TPA: hypothetical protein VK437_06400 [Steroidobacteraceae bacterium]|nr:hypothetical protein [Steroidobacteraceae bacterium]
MSSVPHLIVVLAAALLSACVSYTPGATSLGPAAAPQDRGASGRAPEAPGASYDWHALIVVPFGTLLKDMPLAISEVIEFHDAERGRSDDEDCYTLEGAAPPRFLDERPEEYLLCYRHDRLNHIEATVQIDSQSSRQLFASACAAWLGAAPGALTDACEGRDGTTEWSARLVPGEAARSPASVSMRLTESPP